MKLEFGLYIETIREIAELAARQGGKSISLALFYESIYGKNKPQIKNNRRVYGSKKHREFLRLL